MIVEHLNRSSYNADRSVLGHMRCMGYSVLLVTAARFGSPLR